MCTMENIEDLCKGKLEASSVVMVRSERSCGRGAWVSTMLGAHREKTRAGRTPWGWSQGERPAPPHGTPPRALRRPASADCGGTAGALRRLIPEGGADPVTERQRCALDHERLVHCGLLTQLVAGWYVVAWQVPPRIGIANAILPSRRRWRNPW